MTASDDDPIDCEAPAWTVLAEALEPIDPPAVARRRLLESVEGRARYLPFGRRMLEIFDLTARAIEDLFDLAAKPEAWTAGTAPIVAFIDFETGPACASLKAGLVKMAAGATVPHHRHTDREVTLVLEGSVSSHGKTFTAGEVLEMAAGSEHVFEVGERGAVIALLRGSIEFLG